MSITPGARRVASLLAVAALGPAASGAALAEQGPPPQAQTAAPIDYATAHLERVAHALRVTERIAIDGRLDEPAWSRVDPATNFTQWEPHPGDAGFGEDRGAVSL